MRLLVCAKQKKLHRIVAARVGDFAFIPEEKRPCLLAEIDLDLGLLFLFENSPALLDHRPAR
jgi:hypothetical protein